MTFISGVTPRVLASKRGVLDADDVEASIRKPSVYVPRTSLICLENTHNNWGGSVLPLEKTKAIRRVAEKHGLKVHMDGARIFNAAIAAGVQAKDYAAEVDSIMFCLSKGLSAPVGSMLAGPQAFIDYGRRLRKVFGGGMRQVGVLAAPGIIALTEMRDRLKDDHARAKRLAEAIAVLPGISVDPEDVQTNIIIFGFKHPKYTIPAFLEELKNKGVWAMATTGGIRFVTHKDVGDDDVDRAIAAFGQLLK
jgi:threonine aldolase